MISGTKVNEKLESLPDGTIVRLVGNGWRPRTSIIEIFDKDKYFNISGLDQLRKLNNILTKFVNEETKIIIKQSKGL